jgi:NADH:ubiquinone oxidoreductase subunit 3 (subunit A)
MLGRPFGIMLLAAALLAAGLAGVAVLWAVWPRTSNTSPLAALFCAAWSCAYIAAGVLTWRRSRFAATAFIVAIGLLTFPLSRLFPGGQLFLLPSFVIIFFLALLGYRYLRRKSEAAWE